MMRGMVRTSGILLTALAWGLIPTVVRAADGFAGRWELVPQVSSEISLYNALSLEFVVDGDEVQIVHKWGTSRSFSDTFRIVADGRENWIPVAHRVWPTNVFMGISMIPGAKRRAVARWTEGGKALQVELEEPLRGSQGRRTVRGIHTYRLLDDPDILEYTVRRETRTRGSDFRYILKRAGTRRAFMMRLEDDWRLDGKLPTQAMLISLQGVANKSGPRLYFIYPESWDFRYTPHVYDFLMKRRYYTFTELKSPAQALDSLKQYVRGYVVWDKNVRASLIVAFTVAGLEDAIVVSEDLIPMAEAAGLRQVADLRGKLVGKTDAEIYTWAYEQYWPRCSKDFIIWMGGEYGNVMKPGVADWGILKSAFFNDLSCRKSDTAEYALARKLLSEMNPHSMVMGWHSYKKDLEREFVTLTSNFGHRVEGLHTLPNFSFVSQVPPTPGFRFLNNHRAEPGKRYVPKKKVYIACVQTDGIGLGAWTRPGRGEIPYAWEVPMNFLWMAPMMLEYFYTDAKPNDYFIGCLSGPGYMYPKAVPPALLPKLVDMAYELMQKLDLRVFEIMDYSEGATVEGNTELTRQVVDVYYERMPGAIGFLNGYAPAFTFACRDGRPLISYDYYLSPTRTEEEVVADLYELAAINSKRPYFLLVHVREYSDVARVKSILDKLGPEFEVVPLDIFLKMAGTQPTFEERYLEKQP
jgi:hypothetical protein